MSHEERGRFADVLSQTWATRSPGLYTEEQLRSWAGYTAAEWEHSRERFLACHLLRPKGLWVHPATRAEALASRMRISRAKKAARNAVQKRWRDRDLDTVRITQGAPRGAPIHTVNQSVSETNVPLPADSERGELRHAGAIAGELLAGMAGAFGAAGSGPGKP
jgi:uncharacterized protein YdaU (DUF1376 family)